MDRVKALTLMQESFDSMQRSGMIEVTIMVTPETIVLGTGSMLDSLGFVTLISDLEERVSAETGREHYLILTEIHEANSDQAFLSAGVLANYIEIISG
jgi:acyl carrier protein